MIPAGKPVIVLDTNVLVSAFLRPQSVPAAVLRILIAGDVRLAYDAGILTEYQDVLKRPKLGLDQGLTETVIQELIAEGIEVTPIPVKDRLPDPDDEPFLEAAPASAAGSLSPLRMGTLITGNLKHYPADRRANAVVATPREWLDAWRKTPDA